MKFNEDLVPGVGLPVGNWFWHWASWTWAPTSVDIIGRNVWMRPMQGIPSGPPDRGSYFAIPPYVVSLATGVPALPFADYPIT